MANEETMIPKILVVDDDSLVLKIISAYLDEKGFDHKEAFSGTVAVTLAREYSPDFVILDLMLPGISGREVLQELRRFSNAHVTVLSALGDESDRVQLLEMGADDYIVKPFSPRELVARIEAFVRRRHQNVRRAEILRLENLSIDRDRREVLIDGQLLELTPTEYDLLNVFLENGQRVVSRSRLIQLVWGEEFFIEERVIDVHIRRLRTKIEQDPAAPKIIITSRGAGYRLGDVAQWRD
ncbi:MAG: response regulator transcription factor [Spirochaetaceae bacterium]|nr:response regulator transcription factor [Spirochaetaceae bacterium]MDT8298191.1 response regulator transcription factor [Spirochaetaceae bacterium]